MKLLRHKDLIGQVGLFLLGFCGSLYVALTPANSMMNWYSVDDAFYYYQVARNVVSGYGFTFDQINPANGFHPLWMLVCLPIFLLTRINLLLPLRVLLLVSGIINGLSGVFLYRFLNKTLPSGAAVIGAGVWMLLPSIFNTTAVHGMEAGISSLFLILFVAQSAKVFSAKTENHSKISSFLLPGLFGALAILSRLDNVFVVGIVGVFCILQIKRISRIVIFDLVAFIVAALTAWIVRFGTSTNEVNAISIYPLLMAAFMVKPTVLFFAGLYSPSTKNHLLSFLLRVSLSAVIILVLEYGILRGLQWIGFKLVVSRAVVIIDVLVSILLVMLIRFFFLHPREVALNSPWHLLSNWVKKNLKPTLQKAVLFSIPNLVLVGGYMIANRVLFGVFTPISGQIKLWWGSLANTVYSHKTTLIELLGLSPNSGYGPWSLLTSIIGDISIFLRNLFGADSDRLPSRLFLALCLTVFIILVYLLSRKDGYLARKSFTLLIPALILGCFLQITYYTARGYAHTRGWYWVAEMLTLVLLGSVLLARFFEKLKHWTRSDFANHILTLIGLVLLLFLHTRFVVKLAPQHVPAERQAEYLVTVKQLEKYTEEGSIIGMTGGGNIAYFVENRTIINLDGLINSVEYFKALKNGTAGDLLDNIPVNYIFGKPYMLLETEPYAQIFIGRLDEIGYLRGTEGLTLYRYKYNR